MASYCFCICFIFPWNIRISAPECKRPSASYYGSKNYMVLRCVEMAAIFQPSFWANMQYFCQLIARKLLQCVCSSPDTTDGSAAESIMACSCLTIIVLLVWTEGFHGLMRYNLHMDYSGSFPVIEKEYGPAFNSRFIFTSS